LKPLAVRPRIGVAIARNASLPIETESSGVVAQFAAARAEDRLGEVLYRFARVLVLDLIGFVLLLVFVAATSVVGLRRSSTVASAAFQDG